MRHRRWIIVAGLLLISSFACNFVAGLLGGNDDEAGSSSTSGNGAQATEPAAGQPIAEYYDVNGNPVDYEPPPQEAVELMLGRVAAGEISRSDGVLGLLRTLAGEGSPPAYLDGVEGGVEFRSGWQLSMAANQLYQQTDDPQVRQELLRLHRILAPPLSALQRYSIPAEEWPESQSGQNLQIECSQIWHEGFPETSGQVPTCLLFNHFSADGYDFWVYYPTEMAGDQQKLAYVEAAFEALKDSHKTYSQFTNVRSIALVFSLIDATEIGGPVGGSAFVPALNTSEMGDMHCPITIVKGGLSKAIDSFKQIVAHEVFHCVELWRKGVTGPDEVDWYYEGMAEFFSNLVYPTVNNEFGSVTKFHQQSIENSIFEMSYANTVFFQFLANRNGEAWLFELFDGLPVTDQSAMLAYMSAIPEMDQAFHDFAQDYMDGNIADSGGGTLPGSPLIPYQKKYGFLDDGSHRMEAKPFHIERAAGTYEKETRFELDLELDGNLTEESVRLANQDSWGPMKPVVQTCQSPLDFIHVLTTTYPGSVASTNAKFDLAVGFDEENDCDECLIGVWKFSYSKSDYWDAVMARTANQRTSLIHVGGTRFLTFREDGTYLSVIPESKLIWDGVEYEGAHTQVVTDIQASAVGTYNSLEGGLIQILQEDSTFYSETVSTVTSALGTFVSDAVVDTTSPGAPPNYAEGVAYQCEGDTFQIWFEDPTINWSGYNIYERVSDDPADSPLPSQ